MAYMEKGRPPKNENGSIYYDKTIKYWKCCYYVVNPKTLKKERDGTYSRESVIISCMGGRLYGDS